MHSRSRIGLFVFLLVTASPLASSAQIDCGDTIPARTKVVLTGDVGPCTGAPSLRLEAGASLDLAGFTFFCEAPGTGIVLDGKGARLQNGVISDCFRNVILVGEGNHQVANIVTTGGRVGFLVESSKNRISNGTSIDPVDTGFGFLGGFDVTGDQNRLTDTLSSGSPEIGYRVNGNRNQLTNAVAINSTESGLVVSGTGNKITGGGSTSSGINGLELTGEASTIKQFRAANNAQNGIRISSENSKVQQCTALANGLDLVDTSADCGTNSFRKNLFGTSEADGVADADCIR